MLGPTNGKKHGTPPDLKIAVIVQLQKKNTCTPQPGFSEGGQGRHRNAPNLVHIPTHISTTTTAVAIELGDGIVCEERITQNLIVGFPFIYN